MKITQLKPGKFVTRVNGYGWVASNKLAIGYADGELVYYKNGKPSSYVRGFSSAYGYDDFYYCDQHSNKISTRKPISFKPLY